MTVYLDRLAEAAKRLTPSVGGEVLERVGAELLYSVILENDRPEHQALSQTRLWFGRISVAAVAGQFSGILVGAGSNPGLTVVKGCYVESATVNMFTLPGGAPATFTKAVLQPSFRDSRLKGSPGTTFYARQNAVQLAVNQVVLQINTAYSMDQLGFPYVVATGLVPTQNLFYYEGPAVNTAIAITFWGYERVADAHEVDNTVV